MYMMYAKIKDLTFAMQGAATSTEQCKFEQTNQQKAIAQMIQQSTCIFLLIYYNKWLFEQLFE